MNKEWTAYVSLGLTHVLDDSLKNKIFKFLMYLRDWNAVKRWSDQKSLVCFNNTSIFIGFSITSVSFENLSKTVVLKTSNRLICTCIQDAKLFLQMLRIDKIF